MTPKSPETATELGSGQRLRWWSLRGVNVTQAVPLEELWKPPLQRNQYNVGLTWITGMIPLNMLSVPCSLGCLPIRNQDTGTIRNQGLVRKEPTRVTLPWEGPMWKQRKAEAWSKGRAHSQLLGSSYSWWSPLSILVVFVILSFVSVAGVFCSPQSVNSLKSCVQDSWTSVFILGWDSGQLLSHLRLWL